MRLESILPIGLLAWIGSSQCDPRGVGRDFLCGQIDFCRGATSPRWGCDGQTKSSEEEPVGSLAYRDNCRAHSFEEMVMCDSRLARREQGEGGVVDEKCS